MTRLCFIDTETTGLDPDRHEVYEIGLIVRDSEPRHDQQFRWWLPVDLTKADPVALKIGQFFDRRPDENRTWHGALQWAPGSGGREKGDVREVAATLMELTAGAHLVGAVPSFDTAFLAPLLRAYGCCPAWHYHLVDVEALAAGYLAGKAKADDLLGGEVAEEGIDLAQPPWDSKDLSRAVGVAPEDFDRHTALGDARWARAIYDAVMG